MGFVHMSLNSLEGHYRLHFICESLDVGTAVVLKDRRYFVKVHRELCHYVA